MQTFFALHGQVETADFGLQTEKIVQTMIETGWTVVVVRTPLIIEAVSVNMFKVKTISAIARSKSVMINHRKVGELVVFDQGVSEVEMTAKAWLEQVYTSR